MGQLVFQATLGGQVNLVGPNTASTLNINVPAFAGTMASLATVTNNGVTYVNSSGQPTTGSAITFDGTNFATTGTASATKLIPTGNSATGNGLYLPAANALGLSTNGTNAVYIDASQNVGIGTASPGYRLDVPSADTSTGYAARFRSNATATKSRLQFTDSAASAQTGYIEVGDTPYMALGINAEHLRLTNAGLLQFNSGYGSVATAYGCRAWVNFGYVSSAITVRSSGNVSSVTRSSTGVYVINFTNAITDANYSVNASSSAAVGTSPAFASINYSVSSGLYVAPTTTSCTISVTNAVPTALDVQYVSVVIFR